MKLSLQEITEWVIDNARGLMPETYFMAEDLGYISMCMEHIVKWYYEDYPLGHFLTAVVQNDFRKACTRADDINRKALYLYALFMYNKVPGDYLDKALARLKGP